MHYIPFFQHISASDHIVIIGGGEVALAKTEALHSVAGSLEVVAPQILPELAHLLQEQGGKATVGAYHRDYLHGAKLVIAATNDHDLNREIHRDAKALGIPVNVVDVPSLCDFIFPAIVERGDIKIAISTAGISPTLARLIKRRIEQMLPWNVAQLGAWLKEKRHAVQKKLTNLQARRLFWEEMLDGAVAQEVLEGNTAKADALLQQALDTQPNSAQAALWLVGAGPGHADLITVRGAQLLGQADVILYDRLIAPDLLTRYARKDALKIPVGKGRGTHGKPQNEIDSLIEEHLRAKRIVVRVKGGDPGIYAHAAEEIAIAQRLGAPWQIIPGITAALGCAAYAGIPLTERGGAQSVRFVTFYEEQLQDGAFWQKFASARDETLVFYMSSAHSAAIGEKLLEAGFAPETPMLAIEQGATSCHREYEAPLGAFAAIYVNTEFLSPTLLIVGNVVRWRAQHGWKEPALAREHFFSLPSAQAQCHAS